MYDTTETKTELTLETLRTLEPLPLQTAMYFSQALNREQPYAYFAPAEWDGALTPDSPRYPLLVMLHGINSNHSHWDTYTRIARYAAAYKIVIAFPDGGNGWYTNAVNNGPRYEDDLIEDFIPHLQKTLPIANPGKQWGIGGLSMGGYGAVKIALKHWKLFSVAAGHSGAYEKPNVPEVHPVFGDPQVDGAFRKAENPIALAELALCRWPAERPYLYLDCGADDFLIETNRRFKDHLNFVGYPHTYHEMPGQHTWPYWDRAFRTVLPALSNRLNAERA